MRKSVSKKVIVVGMLFCFMSQGAFSQSNYRLFYNKPAKNWQEALPMGNGRLGIMAHGGVTQEHIQFNEETLWTGKPRTYARKGAHKHLPEIRRLLFEGKQQAARDIMEEGFMSTPRSLMAYQPFGDLIIDFPDHKNHTDYVRELDIGNAISNVSYKIDGVTFNRELFVSFPDQLIAVKLTSDKSESLNFSIRLESVHFQKSVQTNYDQQILDVRPGYEPQRFDPQNPEESVLRGRAGMNVITDGKITSGYKEIKVEGASSATIYLNAYTNFVNYQDVSGNPEWQINQVFKNVFPELEFDEVKKNHIQDYKSYYNRFDLQFEGQDRRHLPTDERIYQFWKIANDPDLLGTYVQFGRYLMISSSRPGGQPANLQGIWNDKIYPPWKSKYTTNINAEMNYWPAEITNLSECHDPFINLINECAHTGHITAREHYNCNGWILHHNTDIWRGTAPINLTNIGTWVGGAGWIAHHLWDRYQFTMNEEFLREHYPVIKGAAQFYSEFLTEDPKSGWLVSTPSNSPEIGGLIAGPTMDHQIIKSLFKICIEASELLEADEEFASHLKKQIPKIAPNQIGKHGQLQEWLEDKDDPNEKHRHVSHLWAVHPGKNINWEETPDLMKAARQSLLYRGDGGTGWSLAWKINFWARFLDGNHAYKLIHNLLSPAEHHERIPKGGSYPNLFDAHPPFQIDGNFGATAGIVELLIQSHLGAIDILPALPDALPNGNISGVCARGGYELSFQWKNSELTEVTVLSKSGKKCNLRYKNFTIEFDTKAGETYLFDNQLKRVL